MPVAIFVADAAVRSVDHHLGLMVGGDATGRIYRLTLSSVGRGNATVALSANTPLIAVGNNMLVPARSHDGLHVVATAVSSARNLFRF